MSTTKLSDSALQKVKLLYQEEYAKTIKRLKELEAVLSELGNVEISTISEIDNSLDRGQENKPAKKAAKASEKPRKYKKKRGRKSIWGKFILSRLKSTQRPLSYEQMTNHALVVKQIPSSDEKKTRLAINSAAFRLRSKDEKIETYGRKGSRERFLALTEWFDENGELLDKYKAKIDKEK